MGSCGFFSKLCSNRGTSDPPPKMVRTNMRSKFSADFSSYALACEKDPALKSFDSSLYQQTSQVISLLAAAKTENQSLSLDSLTVLWTFLLKINQEAVKLIIDSREDVWKNNDLRSLVDIYFKSTSKTLDLCNSVDKCVKSAEIGHLIIRFAVKQFERESLEVGENKNKYAKTLEELNKFKAMGDPFDKHSFKNFELVYEEQVFFLQVLSKKSAKIGKKQRNAKTWRLLSNVVFATAIVSVLVLSVVAAVTGAPPVAAAVAGALTSPMGYAGKWCNKMWKEYERAMNKQQTLVSSLDKSTKINTEAMETIRVQVDKLRIMLVSIQQNVEFAVAREEEEATRFAMKEIKDKVEEFSGKIKEVGENVDKCSKCIALGKVVVLQHIIMY